MLPAAGGAPRPGWPQQHIAVRGALQPVGCVVQPRGMCTPALGHHHPSALTFAHHGGAWSQPQKAAAKVAPPAFPRRGGSLRFGSDFSETSTAASTPSIGGSPGLGSTWSSFTPSVVSARSRADSRASSPGLSCSRGHGRQQQQSSERHTGDALDRLLGSQGLSELLKGSGNASQSVLEAIVSLAEQAVTMCIDYRTLGHSWEHPSTRLQYRQGCHPSSTCAASQQRADKSRQRLSELCVSIANGHTTAEAALVETFLLEIGVPTDGPVASSATFSGVLCALDAELLLPLRALQEGQQCMHRTYTGNPVPVSAVSNVLQELFAATLSGPGAFSEWRYSNPIGTEQLRGLDQEQLAKWKEPTAVGHAGGLRTHEDEEGELGLFWATKIGGPSHGFDYEGQCHLPLLANARSKVVLVSDPAWPAHPSGRAHFRMLWTDPEAGALPEARLWLEVTNCDFDAAAGHVHQSVHSRAVLHHAMEKAETMGVSLSVDPAMVQELASAAAERGGQATVILACESFALRPSNGVCEASDSLSDKHDWVQLEEEVTEPLSRALYVPASCKARR